MFLRISFPPFLFLVTMFSLFKTQYSHHFFQEALLSALSLLGLLWPKMYLSDLMATAGFLFIFSTRPQFHNFGTIGFLAGLFFVVGAALCVVECLAVSLVSIYHMPIAPHPLKAVATKDSSRHCQMSLAWQGRAGEQKWPQLIMTNLDCEACGNR